MEWAPGEAAFDGRRHQLRQVAAAVFQLVPASDKAMDLTSLALVPVALRFGAPGTEIQAPLALVIACGLFSSTALNMFVVPAVYWWVERRSAIHI
jgi:Cu/Ag efflux pump CusA